MNRNDQLKQEMMFTTSFDDDGWPVPNTSMPSVPVLSSVEMLDNSSTFSGVTVTPSRANQDLTGAVLDGLNGGPSKPDNIPFDAATFRKSSS